MLNGTMAEKEVRRLRQGILSQISFLQNLTETNDWTKLIVSNLQSILDYDDDDQHQVGLEVPLKSLTLRDMAQNSSVQVSSSSTVSPQNNIDSDEKVVNTFDIEGQQEGIDQEMNDGCSLTDQINIPRRASMGLQLEELLIPQWKDGSTEASLATVPTLLFTMNGEEDQEPEQQKMSDAFSDLGLKIGRSRGGSWPSTSSSSSPPIRTLNSRTSQQSHHHCPPMKSPNGPQQCPYCPRVMPNLGHWRKHVAMHFAQAKGHKCRHCRHAFRTPEFLQKHYVRNHNYSQQMARKLID